MTHRYLQVSLLALLTAGAACAGTAPAKSPPLKPRQAAAPETAKTSAPKPNANAANADDILGTALVQDYETLAASALEHVLPNLPAPLARALTSEMIWTKVIGGSPVGNLIAQLVDRKGSLALAFVVPADMPKPRRPAVLAVPVADEAFAKAALAKLLKADPVGDGEELVFAVKDEEVWLTFLDGHAYLAGSQRQLRSGVSVLRPRLKAQLAYAVEIEVDLDRFRKRIDSLGKNIDRFVEELNRDDSLREFYEGIKSSNRLHATLKIADRGLDGSIALRGPVAKKAGALWGLNMLPKESALVAFENSTTHYTAAEIREKVVKEISDAPNKALLESLQPLIDQLATPLARFSQAFTSASAFGIWTTSSGGLLFGGPFKTEEGAKIREAYIEFGQAATEFLSAKKTASAFKDAKLLRLSGLKFRTELRRDAFGREKLAGDVAHLLFSWPRASAKNAKTLGISPKELRAKLKQWRKITERLIGKRLTAAWAVGKSNGQNFGYFLVGKDADKALPKLMALATGPGSDLAAKAISLVGPEPIVSMAYLDLARALRSGLGLSPLFEISPKTEKVLRLLQPLAEGRAPVAFWRGAGKGEATYNLHLSAALLAKLVQGVATTMLAAAP